MKNLSIELYWDLGKEEFNFGEYNTDHKIKINDKILLNAGAAIELCRPTQAR